MAANKSKKTSSKKIPLEVEYLTGKYRCSLHPDYKKISKKYSDATPHYLLKEAAIAFEKMAQSAEKDGIKIYIVSGFRSYNRQKTIWEDKFFGHRLVEGINLMQKYPKSPENRVLKILKHSAAPGTSRHHWGTDLDINSVSPSYFEKGNGEKVYTWLVNNASNYGFYQAYTKERKTGYMEEKWHWSYKPLSRKTLNTYLKKITPKELNDFAGHDALPENFQKDFILGINDELI